MKKSEMVREMIAVAKANGQDGASILQAVMERTGLARQLARVYIKGNWDKVKLTAPEVAEGEVAPEVAEGEVAPEIVDVPVGDLAPAKRGRKAKVKEAVAVEAVAPPEDTSTIEDVLAAVEAAFANAQEAVVETAEQEAVA